MELFKMLSPINTIFLLSLTLLAKDSNVLKNFIGNAKGNELKTKIKPIIIIKIIINNHFFK
jgi:hypothetical protein